MSVLGGRLHWLGPALGALVIVTLQDRLAASQFEGTSLIVLGLVLAVLVLLAPEGLAPRIRLRLVPVVVAVVIDRRSPRPDRRVGRPGRLVGGRHACRRRRRLLAATRQGAPSRTSRAAAGGDRRGATGRPRYRRWRQTAFAIGEPIVACSEVVKQFGGLRALDGLSLTIREGELVGLVGPNGSGKTTLVNLMSGAFRPTAGAITVDGTSVTRMPSHRIAHVGDRADLPGAATVPFDDRP